MTKNNDAKSDLLTTENGAPIAEQQALTAGPQGPVLLQDVQLIHFFRADEDYGRRLAANLGIDVNEFMQQSGRAAATIST